MRPDEAGQRQVWVRALVELVQRSETQTHPGVLGWQVSAQPLLPGVQLTLQPESFGSQQIRSSPRQTSWQPKAGFTKATWCQIRPAAMVAVSVRDDI